MEASPQLRQIEEFGANERWFAVRTLPQKELSAEVRLAAQGYRTFLPMMDRTIRHARKISTVERAFFPRYLFVRFDRRRTAWRSINGTIGVDR
ncbi:MAG: transcription termination/antitermination NusG family protein, partial [Pseudomonadota bacterium]